MLFVTLRWLSSHLRADIGASRRGPAALSAGESGPWQTAQREAAQAVCCKSRCPRLCSMTWRGKEPDGPETSKASESFESHRNRHMSASIDVMLDPGPELSRVLPMPLMAILVCNACNTVIKIKCLRPFDVRLIPYSTLRV